MLPIKSGWVRWAPVNAVVNGVITYGNIEKPGGLVSFEDEVDEDIAKLAADNDASYHSIRYYKGMNVTMTLGDEDLDKLATATRLRDVGDGEYVLDPNKTPSCVGVAHLSAMVKSKKIEKYRVTYYPMISFNTPNSSVKTGGDDIEMEPIEIEGEALTEVGIYPKHERDFDTEAEAIAWAEGRLGRVINLRLNLGEGHVIDQNDQHELNRANVRVGQPLLPDALIEGLARIIPPEGMRLAGWALRPAGQVVGIINPGWGQALDAVSQELFAIYERANQEEQPPNNQNQGEG